MATLEQELLVKLAASIRRLEPLDDMSESEQRDAVEAFCRCLDRVVKKESIWDDLKHQTRGRHPDLPRAFLEDLATAFSDAHKRALTMCGYKSPPPPTVRTLMAGTYEAVLLGGSAEQWSPDHVDEARNSLDEFCWQVDAHLRSSGSLIGLVHRVRRKGAVALLLIMLSHIEWKTGNELSVDLSISTDSVVVEITVPLDLALLSSSIALTYRDTVALTYRDTATILLRDNEHGKLLRDQKDRGAFAIDVPAHIDVAMKETNDAYTGEDEQDFSYLYDKVEEDSGSCYSHAKEEDDCEEIVDNDMDDYDDYR